MIAGTLLQHVPGCEDGELPYSQELIGGGKVNRSFLVRTRRGRFVVRLNENAAADPGLDRERELALHTRGGAAPASRRTVVYAAPDRSCLITEFVDGRLWTPHYFTRMRDLRSLGAAAARAARADSAAGAALRSDGRGAALRRPHHRAAIQPRPARIQLLLDRGAEALARSGSDSARRAHRPQRPASRQRAHRRSRVFHRLGIRAGRRSAARSRLHHGVLPARGAAWRAAARRPPGLDERGVPRRRCSAELTNVFTLLTYLWYRARRVSRERARHRPAARIRARCAACLRWRPTANLGTLAPRICANSQGAGKRNGDAAGD